MSTLEALSAGADWEKMGGLLPAIVQDAQTGSVLMLGYMNQEALAKTFEGFVTFFSRSKGRLWTKGEGSGNMLQFESAELDCDGDALLVRAIPSGPVCHLGTERCFAASDPSGFLGRLEAIIASRAASGDEGSYTRRLLDRGQRRIAQKVGEEGVETALAGATGDESLPEEAADLLYHLLVLLHANEISLIQVLAVLARRHTEG
jgi:phosphoribosyl-ATP pyrophosphohydrolase/phosphoribosyl-AMP cyclohydrolase